MSGRGPSQSLFPAPAGGAVLTIDEQALAACSRTDPEAFFPEKGKSSREAKQVCAGCEIRERCLEVAIANGERFGIWGGLSDKERRRVARGLEPSTPERKPSRVHGSVAGRRQHKLLGETPCAPCVDAWEAYRAALSERASRTNRQRAEKAGTEVAA